MSFIVGHLAWHVNSAKNRVQAKHLTQILDATTGSPFLFVSIPQSASKILHKADPISPLYPMITFSRNDMFYQPPFPYIFSKLYHTIDNLVSQLQH